MFKVKEANDLLIFVSGKNNELMINMYNDKMMFDINNNLLNR
jgi:hypothetical protein